MSTWYIGKPCWYCGDPSDSRDHLHPQSQRKGCPSIPYKHIVPACRPCNHAKGNQAVAQFRKWLKKKFENGSPNPVVHKLAAREFKFHGETHGHV